MNVSAFADRFRELYPNLYKNKSDEEVFNLLVKYPKLMQRPIVVSDRGVILGRPPENVFDII